MKYYVVDTFTEKMFSGNPAGVCLAEHSLDEQTMQNIAAENNLAATAFVFRNGNNFDLRWFTTEIEIELCGHATLASAVVVSNFLDKGRKEIIFNTKSGELRVNVKKNLMDMQDLYEMDFPALETTPVEITPLMTQAAGGTQIAEAHLSRDLILLVNSEDALANLVPDFDSIRAIPECHGVVITAKGNNKFDFVSRFFAPNMGISEDSVTGSSHSELIPFWSKRLNKEMMTARQLSARGGVLFCEYHGSKVKIAGKASLYMNGEINI